MNISKQKILAFFTAGTVLAGTADIVINLEGATDTSFKDGGGVNTVCVGHTDNAPSKIKIIKLKTYTPAECADLLKKDLAPTYNSVSKLIPIPVTEMELAGYTSFAFNVGIEAFKGSTLLKLLNKGDRVGAAKQLHLWIKDNGVISQGLVNRRQEEYEMAMTGIQTQKVNIK